MYSESISSPFVRFGYQYLGPFLLDWYNRLLARLGPQVKSVYCIGREGWALVSLFNTLEAMGGGRLRFKYLTTSRGLLTHLCLTRPDLLEFTLASRFEGSIRLFAESRLGVPFELLTMSNGADQIIKLPRDGDYLRPMLDANILRLRPVAERSNYAYGKYLSGLGFAKDDTNYVTDLGFRGTSQALLTALFGYEINGLYAMLDPSGVPAPLKLARSSTQGLFCDSHAFGEGYAPLDGSLLFEVFLTSPSGQAIGIQEQACGDPFIYRKAMGAQDRFELISGCHQGAHKFAHDNLDLIGAAEPIIVDFESYFVSFRESLRRNISMFSEIVDIDDSYFGGSELNAGVKL